MASTPTAPAKAPSNRLFVLALGLLVGFVFGFVMLLSRLPVDGTLGDFSVQGIQPEVSTGSGYQFYTVLQDQTVKQQPRIVSKTQPEVLQAVIPPATRIVPGSAQTLSARGLAAEGYAEIPASSFGKESYYLQAGVYSGLTDAERARAAVLLLGLDAFIEVRHGANGSTGHHVRIGPFFDKVKVTNAKQRLQKGGINYRLLRVTG